jgi:hypothetical protein
MQFRRPTIPGSSPPSPGFSVDKPTGRPEWFKEWLEDKGKWVELECGHKVDLNERGQLNLVGTKRGDMLTICEQCWQFCAVKRHISHSEYREISAAVIPDEPPF